ncbi:MAG: TolC family protein, partial [Bdellovibrionales bacterium]|nr:TolC family protein [Bdellovibrionales bacterium]
MRLEESVALALRHNRTIKSAYLNRISEKYTLQVAEDEFNLDYSITPQYGLSSTGRSAVDVPRVNTHSYGSSFSLSKRAKTGASLSFAWANSITDAEEAKPSLTTSWTLSATQPLLRGAGIDVNTVNLRTARITNENNILSLQSTLISTITSIITTYRTYLQTYRKRNIAKQALNRTKKQLKVNK